MLPHFIYHINRHLNSRYEKSLTILLSETSGTWLHTHTFLPTTCGNQWHNSYSSESVQNIHSFIDTEYKTQVRQVYTDILTYWLRSQNTEQKRLLYVMLYPMLHQKHLWVIVKVSEWFVKRPSRVSKKTSGFSCWQCLHEIRQIQNLWGKILITGSKIHSKCDWYNLILNENAIDDIWHFYRPWFPQ